MHIILWYWNVFWFYNWYNHHLSLACTINILQYSCIQNHLNNSVIFTVIWFLIKKITIKFNPLWAWWVMINSQYHEYIYPETRKIDSKLDFPAWKWFLQNWTTKQDQVKNKWICEGFRNRKAKINLHVSKKCITFATSMSTMLTQQW